MFYFQGVQLKHFLWFFLIAGGLLSGMFKMDYPNRLQLHFLGEGSLFLSSSLVHSVSSIYFYRAFKNLIHKLSSPLFYPGKLILSYQGFVTLSRNLRGRGNLVMQCWGPRNLDTFIMLFSMYLQCFTSLIHQRRAALSYGVWFPSAIIGALILFTVDIIITFNSIPTIKIN